MEYKKNMLLKHVLRKTGLTRDIKGERINFNNIDNDKIIKFQEVINGEIKDFTIPISKIKDIMEETTRALYDISKNWDCEE